MNLSDYDLVIVNSSAGKDSLCALYEITMMAAQQGYPNNRIIVSHQDLGRMEWAGTRELAKKQADLFGLRIYYSKRRDRYGNHETLLEYVKRRGKWPSNKQRYCTSDFKRGPGARIVTQLTRDMKNCKVLYVFGFRESESPARAKKKVLSLNKKLTTRSRIVYDYLPIHHWSTKKVWDTIRNNNLPYHWAYDLGIPRLSCCFCIFSPFDALVVAGIANPDLLDEYVEVEQETGHSFRNDFTIKSVQDAIRSGYQPKKISDWIM